MRFSILPLHPNQHTQLVHRPHQIGVDHDVRLAIIVEAVQGVVLIAVLVFAASATQSSRRAA